MFKHETKQALLQVPTETVVLRSSCTVTDRLCKAQAVINEVYVPTRREEKWAAVVLGGGAAGCPPNSVRSGNGIFCNTFLLAL